LQGASKLRETKTPDTSFSVAQRIGRDFTSTGQLQYAATSNMQELGRRVGVYEGFRLFLGFSVSLGGRIAGMF
jgi:hypothetical protein